MKRRKWFAGALVWLVSALLLAGCSADEVNTVLDVAGQGYEVIQSLQQESAAEVVSAETAPDQNEDTDAAEFTSENEDTYQSEDTVLSEDAYEEEDEDSSQKPDGANLNDPAGATGRLDEYGSYSSKEDVALYLNTFERLPDNYITKEEAEKLGWSGGSLESVAPGKCIGGNHFGNYEKKLPVEKGRKYYECDIDTLGKKSRGAKRIVYSNDGLIYYTDDHYETFTLLYGEE